MHYHRRMRNVTRAVWIGLFVLIAVGLAGVALRAILPADAAARLEPLRTALLTLLGRFDPLAAERASEIAEFDGRFAAHPLAVALHIGTGGLFLALVPIQLWRGFRNRHPAAHRRLGRVAIGLGLIMVASALYFGLLMPFAGSVEAVAMALVSGWYVFATARAVLAIRRGDRVRHREWMLRAVAVPLGVATIRIVGFALELALVELGLGPRVLFQLAVWIGWTLTLVGAEAWIHATRISVSGTSPEIRVA